MSFAAAVMAFAVMGQLPFSTQLSLPSGDLMQIEGDRLAYDAEQQRLTIKGHAVLRKGQLLLRADELSYDQAHERASATGHVMLVMGLFTAVGDSIDADLRSMDSFEAGMKDLIAQQKLGVTTEQLMAAKTPEELRKLGKSMLTLTGTHIKRVGKDEYVVDDLSFTPCDCSAGQPSWRITARHADVEMGERAILTWPLVYVGPVPLLPLPWLYLPLSDRRTGLLVPRPVWTGQNGFSIDQPIFFALDRSYDLTLTPGYYAGTTTPALTPYGIKGPRLQSEFNYALSDKTLGRMTLGVIDDLRSPRDPVNPFLTTPGTRGLRGEASIRHVQDLGDGFYDRVDAAFLSDGNYWRDLTTDVLAAINQYLRSTAVIYHRDADSYAGVDVTVRQNLQWGYNLFGTDLDSLGKHGPNTIDRLPHVQYVVADRPLAGPVWGGLHLEYTRLAPLVGLTGDEGPDGYYDPNGAATTPYTDPGQGDHVFQPGEREARDRIDFRPHVMASLPIGQIARVVPYLAYREDLYLGEITGTMAHRGYAIGGAIAETELSKVYDAGGGIAFRHTATPNVEVRGVPYIFGAVPSRGNLSGPTGYDEIDAAIPGATLNPLLANSTDRSLAQAIVDVRQTLAVRRGAAVKQLVLLDLGQDLDLLHGRAADTFGRLVASAGLFNSTSIVRYDLSGHHLDQLSTEVSIDDFKGNAVYGRYDQLLSGGSDRQRAGIDALVGDPLSTFIGAPASCAALGLASNPGCPAFSSAEQLVAGFRFKLPFGLAGRYEALFQPQNLPPLGTPPEGWLAKTAWKFPMQVAAVSYGPACDCWRVEAHAVFYPSRATPDVGLSLSISRFGTFGN